MLDLQPTMPAKCMYKPFCCFCPFTLTKICFAVTCESVNPFNHSTGSSIPSETEKKFLTRAIIRISADMFKVISTGYDNGNHDNENKRSLNCCEEEKE